jgi:hypothetical protein
MYKYLVITNGNKEIFPSNSRNSKKHLIENNATNCWIYGKNGWLVSFAELDKSINKTYHPKMFLDGEPRKHYVKILKQLNEITL